MVPFFLDHFWKFIFFWLQNWITLKIDVILSLKILEKFISFFFFFKKKINKNKEQNKEFSQIFFLRVDWENSVKPELTQQLK